MSILAARAQRGAIRRSIEGQHLDGWVGPLTDAEFHTRCVVEYRFDASAADAVWAAVARAEFTLNDIGRYEGWVWRAPKTVAARSPEQPDAWLLWQEQGARDDA